MKDRVEIALVVRTDELSGKAVKAVASVIGKAIQEVKPQLMKLIEASTNTLTSIINNEAKKEVKE